jgi:TetR/AcrR family transcriptional regulator, regulator of autoinduction and epiphytic fitness
VQEAPRDGRTARALRTREAIVDATIQLLEAGDLRPTAPRIAEQAHVSVRSVFQHFADLEALHTAVAERLVERVAVLVVPIGVHLPLHDRLERFVRQRGQLLEAVTPIRRAAEVHGPFSEEITRWLRDGQRFLRDEVAHTFSPELEDLDEPDRADAIDALDVACSWSTWFGLRTTRGRDTTATESIVRRLVLAVLTTSPAARGLPSMP